MLTLPIKQPWYDMIHSGKKPEEYRARTSYWEARLETAFDCSIEEAIETGARAVVRFRNGYRADSPSFTALVRLWIGPGREEWGAMPGVKYFILRILEINPEEVNP